MTIQIQKSEMESFLPLTPSRFHVLLALAGGEKHGYAILKEISRQSSGRIKTSVSTLYSVIQRLENDRLIIESEERPDPALDDERRRYYRLTDLGQAVARAETERLEDVISVARTRNLTKAAGKA